MYDVLYAFWLFLPAGVANVTPILVTRIPLLKRWNYPFDFYRSFRGKRIFGSHKTWRGVVTGTFMAVVTFWLQQKLAPNLGDFSVYLEAQNYMDLPAILGILLGFGALFGDAVESFFKRQRGILPGKKWVPFDQLDYVLGSTLFALPVIIVSLSIYVWVFVLWFAMHLVFSYIGYQFGLKRNPI